MSSLSSPKSPIRIRVYQPKDLSQFKRLFYEGMAYGPRTPAENSAQTVRNDPISYLLYFTGAISSIFLSRTRRFSPIVRTGGTLFASGVVLSYLLWIYRTSRRMMVNYCDQCFREDLKDIVKHYQLAPVDEDDPNSEYQPTSTSCFWVAEQKLKEDGEYEIVGCVALDNSDGSSAGELRRMSVSSKQRRGGIGSALLRTITAFAEEKGLSSLRLTTSSYQPDAVVLYKKRGWKLTNTSQFKVQEFPVTFDMYTMEYDFCR